MAKNRYKVRDDAGPHEDGPPGQTVIYTKGDVVESDKRLDLLFPNKFIRLAGKKDEDIDPSTPAGRRKAAAQEPTEAARREALEEAQDEALEEAAEEEPRVKGRKPMMKKVKGGKGEAGEKRGQHARAGQEGGSSSDEELQPEDEDFTAEGDEPPAEADDVSDDSEVTKPRRKKGRPRNKG